MVSLDGKLHFYPKWFFDRIGKMHRTLKRSGVHILEWDKAIDHWKIQPAILSFKELFELPHYNPQKRLRAHNLEFSGKIQVRRGLIDLLYCGIPFDPEQKTYSEELAESRGSSQHAANVVADVVGRRKEKLFKAVKRVRGR